MNAIAEILGWTKVAEDAPPFGQTVWELPDGSQRWGDAWTVDDMLAWLRERGYLLDSLWWDEVGTGPDPLAGEYVIELSQPCFVDGWFPFGPTVHAAVEAAVRAVAEAT